MGNPFVHVELSSTDLDKAKAFYKSLFQWKLEDMPMENGKDYTMIEVGEGTGGGMMKHSVPGAPSMWLPYVMVDDVEAATNKAKQLGGKIIKEQTAVKDYGWFSIIQDPTGAMLGLWMVNKDSKGMKDKKDKKEGCGCGCKCCS